VLIASVAGELWKSPLEWDIPTAQHDLPLGSELDWTQCGDLIISGCMDFGSEPEGCNPTIFNFEEI
jgi:hypothetical protein